MPLAADYAKMLLIFLLQIRFRLMLIAAIIYFRRFAAADDRHCWLMLLMPPRR